MSEVWGQRRRGRTLLVDAAIAGLYALFALATAVQQGPSAILTTALLALALLVRRTSTPIMAAAAGAAGVTQLAAHSMAYGAAIAYPAVFFILGAHRDRRWRKVGLIGAGAAVISAALLNYLWPLSPAEQVGSIASSLVVGGLAALFAVGGWVTGYLRLLNQRGVEAHFAAQVQSVEQLRLREAIESERERSAIATDMHDVVAHSLAVVAAQADGARYALRSDPDAAEQALNQIGDTARVAIGDLRTILARLRDPDTLPPAPGEDQQSALLSRMRAAGMTLRVHEQGARPDSPLLALTAHRLLSESLTNALKHGDPAEPVEVSVDWTDGYRLEVSNVVRQGDSTSGMPGTGHGVPGMRERAALAGGTLTAGPEGLTWVIRAHIPTPELGSTP